jgi:hypothetical protein
MTAQRQQTASNFLNKRFLASSHEWPRGAKMWRFLGPFSQRSCITGGPRLGVFRLWDCGACLGQRIQSSRASPRPSPGPPASINHDFINKNHGFVNFGTLWRRLLALYSAASGLGVCPQFLWTAYGAFVTMARSSAAAVVAT